MGGPSHITTPLLWRSDLLTQGHSPDQIRWALTSQRWLALRRGVYVERETFTSLSAREQHLLRALALHQSLNCDHVLSHHTALAFHGLAPLHPLMDVTLTTHRDLRRHVVGAQVFTTRDLALHRIDHVTPWGTSLPVTSLARTIVDIARTCDLPTTLVAAESALSRDLTQRRDWGDVLDQLPRWPGVNQAQRSLELATPHCADPLLSWFRGLFLTLGLPNPLCGVSVSHQEHAVGTFDFVWPDQAVIVMLDRADATADAQLQRLRDLRKQEDLMRMQGYIVLTVTTHELIHQARAVVARINSALARAAA